MSARHRCASLVLVAATLGGCGAGGHHPAPRHSSRERIVSRPDVMPTPSGLRRPRAAGAHPRRRRPAPQALVAAETVNRVFVVNLRSGAVTGRLAVPGAPQYVNGAIDLAVVSSPAAGTVSVLTGPHWRVLKVVRGFLSPHIVALSPDGDHAFVTDDRRGTLSVITLTDDRVTGTVFVGRGAHHFAASPDQQRVWVALGESARTIVVVDTSDIDHPAVIGRLHPGFAAHDLSFSPDGRRVWITSSAGPDVSVFDARDRHRVFSVPVGAPPQHVAFLGGSAYLTSGYGGVIEKVAASSGMIERRARTPHGSFELSAADGYVVTVSLLNGKMAVFTPALALVAERRPAPATRDVSVVVPQRG